MNQVAWTDFFQKLLSILFAGAGTWLAMRNYYEKRQNEIMDRHAKSETKAYAAERDFEHLKNNLAQMKEALKILDDEISANREDLKEVKGMLVVAFGRSGESGFFGQRGKGE